MRKFYKKFDQVALEFQSLLCTLEHSTKFINLSCDLHPILENVSEKSIGPKSPAAVFSRPSGLKCPKNQFLELLYHRIRYQVRTSVKDHSCHIRKTCLPQRHILTSIAIFCRFYSSGIGTIITITIQLNEMRAT